MRRLLDTSALINLLKGERLRHLSDAMILDLTVYEALNFVWKELYLLKKIDENTALRLTRALKKIFDTLEILSMRGYEEKALELAIKHGITVYDASYIAIAAEKGLILVTDDCELSKVASSYVKVLNSLNLE
jgi:predicted nucleic acid-binding protein